MPALLTPATMSEATLQGNVMHLARVLGWFAYHPWLSVKSVSGYPDTTLVHPRQKRLVWAELKGPRGVFRIDQEAWAEAIAQAGGEWYLWTPADWYSGLIEQILRGGEA